MRLNLVPRGFASCNGSVSLQTEVDVELAENYNRYGQQPGCNRTVTTARSLLG